MKKILLLIVCTAVINLSVFAQDVLTVTEIDGVGNVAITGNLQISGNLDVDGLIDKIIGILMPTGSIVAYGGSDDPDTIPAGWLLCDGGSYSTDDYSALYDVVANAFGGDASSFNVPDLRGVFLRGAGENGTMMKSNDLPYNGGDVGEEKDDVLDNHTHPIDHDHSPEITTSDVTLSGIHVGYGSSVTSDYGHYKTGETTTNGDHEHSVDLPLFEGDSRGVDGARSGDETAPASVSVNYIIKF
ncbi:MAG: tail fiber protein [Spirochaetales bacterium]|nr:tail fiber protein [Spirochaetales bacterium]